MTPSFSFSPDVLANFLRKIYRGFDISKEIEPTMWRAVLNILNEAVVDGLTDAGAPPTREEDFYAELKHSTEVFSAFKVHAMGTAMAERLTGEDGKLKPFAQWARDVSAITSHHVGAWLRTEYDTAIIRAHNAADWRGFERDKDVMPNLRWMPTTSPTPESSHRAFWERKLTLPVDDPFWSAHHPGDRWNCKCSLEQTDEPATPELKEDLDGDRPQRGLENNPGRDGHVFSDRHPYFPDSCARCDFYRKANLKNRLIGGFSNRRKDCYNCPYINGCLELAKNNGFILKNKYTNGGELYIHPKIDKDKPDYHPIVNIGQYFAKMGKVVRVTPRVHIKSPEYRNIYKGLIGTRYEGKCPDLQVDDKYYEFEGFVKPWKKRKSKNMIRHGLEQSQYIVIDNTKGGSDRLIRRNIVSRNHNEAIKEVWLYEKGGLRLFFKDGKFQ